MPTISFEVGKKYITRCGRLAQVDQITPDGKWRLIGRTKGRSAIWNEHGHYDKDGNEHANDIVSELTADTKFEKGKPDERSRA
jgi:hypothetical protein